MKSAEEWFDGAIVFTESIALEIQIDALQEALYATQSNDNERIEDLIVRLKARQKEVL